MHARWWTAVGWVAVLTVAVVGCHNEDIPQVNSPPPRPGPTIALGGDAGADGGTDGGVDGGPGTVPGTDGGAGDAGVSFVDAGTFDAGFPFPGGFGDGGFLGGFVPGIGFDGGLLTQAEAVQIMLLANDAEVQDGISAQQLGSGDANGFGGKMVTEHSAANQRLTQVAQGAGVAPAQSALSLQLTAQAQQDLAILRSTSAGTFNTAYLDLQVAVHAQLISLAQSTLQPSLQNPQLQAELVRFIATAQQHLTTALRLQATSPVPAPGSAGAQAPAIPMTDRQIAGLLVQFEAAQQQASQRLATTPNLTPELQAYSTQLAGDVTVAQQRTNAALQAAGLTPQAGPLTPVLAADVNAQNAALNGLVMPSFGRVFSANQVANDGRMLFWQDALLTSQARNTGLVQELVAFRSGLQTMLARAATLQASGAAGR